MIETDRAATRFFAGRVRELRRRLEEFGSKRAGLTALIIMLLLRDLDNADRARVVLDLVGLLRPRNHGALKSEAVVPARVLAKTRNR
jgi:hypothetical protein